MISKIESHRYKTAVISIILFAFLIRILLFLFMNIDINCDEAMLSINAKSIANNGKDIYGTSFPVYFEAWAWSGQSALPTYLCVLFIKLFGYGINVVRLPFLILSLIAIVYFYFLNKLLFDKREALVALALLAICPWHYVQQLIGLDCNMFPHVFVIGLYYLIKGLRNNKNGFIYLSMVFMALCLYCYGTSVFFIPFFLLIVAANECRRKNVRVSVLIKAAMILLLFSMPILTMYVVNFFKLNDIKIGPITIQNFLYQTRSEDILLFSNNIGAQFINNLICLFVTVFCQIDMNIWNYVPWFGTVYLVSIVFIVLGFDKYNKKTGVSDNMVIIYAWFICSLIMGILINSTNINRLNIIWYVLLVLCSKGIIKCIERYRKAAKIGIQVLYSVLFAIFLICLISIYPKNIRHAYTFSQGSVEAYNEVKDKSEVYVSQELYYSFDMLVFAYNEIGSDNDYRFNSKDVSGYEEYYKQNDVFVFNKRFNGIEITDGMVLDKDNYIIGEPDLEKIENINDYSIEEFGEYYVLYKI